MWISIIALIWVYRQPTSAFGIAPMAPYLALVTILTSRVHRNTKLGLYHTDSLQSNDPKSQPHSATYSMLRGKAAKPISIAVTDVENTGVIIQRRDSGEVPLIPWTSGWLEDA